MSLGRFAATWVALDVGQEVADYLLQNDMLAGDKGKPGPLGREACAVHCAIVVATQAACLGIVRAATGERVGWRRAALGLVLSGVTHYAADRKDHGILPGIEERLRLTVFSGLGVAPATGRHYIDQTVHKAAQFGATALVAGRGASTRPRTIRRARSISVRANPTRPRVCS